MELLSKLGVDWKLLLAQIVNFAILAGVLSAFIYRPLLDLIDARRERTRKAMEDARKIEGQKAELARIREEALRRIDEECGTILERAKQEAQMTRAEMLASTKEEVEQLLTKGGAQLAEERSRAYAEMQGSLARLIVRLTEKILEREFSSANQERLLTTLQKQIPSLMQ